jgi:hypothetical protein
MADENDASKLSLGLFAKIRLTDHQPFITKQM